MLERRTLPVELRADTTDGVTRISWYPAVFDSLSEDLGGFRERVGRRAFTRTLAEDDFAALFNHNPDWVMGRKSAGTLTTRADVHGLSATVELPDTQWARDLAVSINRGDINSGSFGFTVQKDSWDKDEEGAIVRTLQDVRLFDVSVVTYPAYPGTAGSTVVRDLSDVLASLSAPELPEEPSFNHRLVRERKLKLLEIGGK